MAPSSRSIIATSVALLALGIGSALADPDVTEKTKTYSVSATTVDGLKREMKRRGPKGFWAYTTWRVNWTGSCAVRLKINYTMPKHSNPDAMSPELRRQWDAMVAALISHEREHGAHGLAAAREVEAAGCRNTKPIFRKYKKADRALDKRTLHGYKTGVVLE